MGVCCNYSDNKFSDKSNEVKLSSHNKFESIPIRNENDSRKYQLVDNSLLSGNNNVNLNSDESSSLVAIITDGLIAHVPSTKKNKKVAFATRTFSEGRNHLYFLPEDIFNVVLEFLSSEEVASKITLLSKSINEYVITAHYWQNNMVVVTFIPLLYCENAGDYYCNSCLENGEYDYDICISQECKTLNRCYVQQSKIPHYAKDLFLKFSESDFSGWQDKTFFCRDSGLENLKNVIKLYINNFSFFLIDDWCSLRFLYLNVGDFKESLQNEEDYKEIYLNLSNLNAPKLEHLCIQDSVISDALFSLKKLNQLKTLSIKVDERMFINQNILLKKSLDSCPENIIIDFNKNFYLYTNMHFDIYGDFSNDELYLYHINPKFSNKALAPFQSVFEDNFGLRSIITHYDNLKSLNLRFIIIGKRNFPSNLDSCSFTNNSIENLTINIEFCKFVDFSNILPIFQNLKHLNIYLNDNITSRYKPYEFEFKVPKGLETISVSNYNTSILLENNAQNGHYKLQCSKDFFHKNKYDIIENNKNTIMPSPNFYIKNDSIIII